MTSSLSPYETLSRRRFLKAAAGGASTLAALAVPGHVAAFSGGDLPTPLQQASGDWKLTFEDDFNDPVRFHAMWELLKRGGHKHLTMRYPRNVVVEDGELDLNLGHQNDPKRPFTGGYIRSRSFRQTYGYFECEMRIANEAGVNNAFWMVSDRSLQGDTQFELDVAEVKYPNIVQVSARRWKPEKIVLAATYRSNMRLDETFHRYAMLWNENEFRFYVDDLEVFDVENSFAHTPAMLLFSNAVAPFAGKNDGDVAGAATTVRNVRVFQDLSA
ncbi:MAG: family 16 glycosylhydrolase [Roseibium album]|uniref:family 16 glycosylhydrolase n=1 Tax=Roseibium album TaxID=311410 RepID=UPI000D561540|nr:family 16 glycosylhydrolase [Roseibium album]MBG6159171.1 beta-glucanase (GH16 family) [Labrenzia sp. EL_162]MBG6165231.1 beta-glucanase (GH16 family) [Labrenzia sp. EL_195]MBG6197741.1 beta-glucanase (GH16 family) [Labrenzia sp. EL_159]MCR9055710.1 family 16 glycosylhydrolase [Paracoccaceae bacterium]